MSSGGLAHTHGVSMAAPGLIGARKLRAAANLRSASAGAVWRSSRWAVLGAPGVLGDHLSSRMPQGSSLDPLSRRDAGFSRPPSRPPASCFRGGLPSSALLLADGSYCLGARSPMQRGDRCRAGGWGDSPGFCLSLASTKNGSGLDLGTCPEASERGSWDEGSGAGRAGCGRGRPAQGQPCRLPAVLASHPRFQPVKAK